METDYGNPSSTHFVGRAASELLEASRAHVASALGAKPSDIVFTSGGTESDNLAIFGAAQSNRHAGRHVITSAVEHDAVRKSFEKLASRGYEVTVLSPDKRGAISASDLISALRDDTVLVSLMLVNNETGAINPVSEYADAIRKRSPKALLHTDAVQAFCKIPFAAKTLGADLITVSAHKIGGVKGAGALYVRQGLRIPPSLFGGGQESGRRAGTEAMPAIAAFGEAARLGCAELGDNYARVQALRERIVAELTARLPGVVFLGGGSPYILSLSLPGHRSEVLLSSLESQSICVSKSSACKKGARSHVLSAMRLENAVIDGAVRVSFSPNNTPAEGDYFVSRLVAAAETLFTRKR
jgi:cysteine desulfurase